MTKRSVTFESPPPFALATALCFLSTIAWGVFAGTRVLNLPLAEGWAQMPPREFVAWFADNQPRFNGLLFPLGAITGVLSAMALFTAWPWRRTSPRRRFWLGIAAMSWAVVFSLNPLFYDRANELLATPGALTDEQVRATLASWSNAQLLRTAISIVGLCAATAGFGCTVSDRRAAYIEELA